MTAAEKPHIAVIGAGLSGLRCADVLLQHGLRVTVLEGRDRVGGRLHQTRLANDHWIDMGPNWIHGATGNIMLDLAMQTGTAAVDVHDVSCSFDETGDHVPTLESVKYETIMWDMIEEAFELSETKGESVDAQKSLVDFFEERLPVKIADGDEGAAKKRKIVRQLCEGWGAFIGSPAMRQSLRFFWLEKCIDDENLFCAGTYRKILESIARPVLEKAEVSFNTTVEKITYGGDKVQLDLKGGKTQEFDQVVVTTPLGWLQKNKATAFDPPLPKKLDEAIDAISYGSLEKVFVSFPKAFWQAKDGQPEIARGFIQWIAPDYHAANPQRWPQEAFELASLGADDAHPTLLFYSYGEQSRWFTSELAKCATKEAKMALMVDFFKPYYSRLPNYVADAPECQPVECVATEWLNDDLAGNGSYGNFQIGLERADEHIQVMREGLPDQKLWMAGEHTAPYVALGTTTGAYWSGEAVGERIIEKYEL